MMTALSKPFSTSEMKVSKTPVADMHMKEKKQDKVTITYNDFLCFFRFLPTDLHMYIGNDDDCVYRLSSAAMARLGGLARNKQ